MVSTSEVRRRPHNLFVGEKNFEVVPSFTYLVALINNIRQRIQAGNWACCANLHLFKNQLISRSTTRKICRTLVRPVVTYGAETWSLTVADENALWSFERRTLRKIFGPVWDRGELSELIKRHDILRFVKAQRIRWVGHVERMSDERMPKRMLKGRLFSRRRKGRPRTRWLDSVVMDLMVMVVRGWRRLVKEAKAHQGL